MRPDLEGRIRDLEIALKVIAKDYARDLSKIISPECQECLDIGFVLVDGHDSTGHFVTKKVECPTCKDLL
jgi:hypothetical protein